MTSLKETDYRQCTICSRLADHERGFQKLGQPENDTHLPPAAALLKSVKEVKSKSGSPHEIWQCPECTTYYLYRFEYEFLYGYGGSEDTQELTRLTTAEAVAWLELTGREKITDRADQPSASATSAKPMAPAEGAITKETVSVGQSPAPVTSVEPEAPTEGTLMITKESVSVDASEPGFVKIEHAQLDDGVDMGGRLLLERQSVPLIIALLHSSLNMFCFQKVVCQCGADSFRVYESGSDQEPMINILNRRPDGVPHEGLSGLMLTRAATQILIEQLQGIKSG